MIDAADARIPEVLAQLEAAEVAALTRDLVDIASPVGEETELARFLGNRLERAGLRVELPEVEPGRCNLLAVLEGTGGGRRVLFGGHLDTPYRGDEEGIRELGAAYQPRARVEGDWIFGLSAANMKGGLASAVVAIEAIARARTRLRGDLIVAGIVGETCHVPVARYQGIRYRGTGAGAHALLAAGVAADCAIFPIPTAGTISVASGGFVYLELTVRAGPASTYQRATTTRASRPRDAVSKTLDLVPLLRAWGEDYTRARTYRGRPAGHAAIIAIEGGLPFRPSKLASACRLYFEVGTMPDDDPQAIVRGVRERLREIEARDPELRVELQVIAAPEGAETDANEPVVQALADACAATYGRPAELTWDGWCTDAALFTRAGIPAASFGAQGRTRSPAESFLTAGEHVDAKDLVRGAEVFVRAGITLAMQERS